MGTHVIVGLGNPDDEHAGTRHNTGRMAVTHFHGTDDFGEWKQEKKPPMLWAKGAVAGKKSVLLLPNTYMNNSGRAVAHFVKSKKEAGNCVVIYDDLDLPLGTIKISHDRSSGGHNGVESVIRALKTRAFVRVRIGISRKSKPTDPIKFLLSKFSPAENAELKKIFKRVDEALTTIVTQGYQASMTAFN